MNKIIKLLNLKDHGDVSTILTLFDCKIYSTDYKNVFVTDYDLHLCDNLGHKKQYSLYASGNLFKDKKVLYAYNCLKLTSIYLSKSIILKNPDGVKKLLEKL